jgi:hypothetical protein
MKGTIFWEITTCIPLKVNRLSEEHIASIFSIEKSEQDTNVKAGGKPA